MAALATLTEMFGGDKADLHSQVVLNEALSTAFDSAAHGQCDTTEFLLGMLDGWPQLQATNLTANLAIGGHTDFVYGELFDI